MVLQLAYDVMIWHCTTASAATKAAGNTSGQGGTGGQGHNYAYPNEISDLLDGRPELTGSTRDKLVATVQNQKLSEVIDQLYRPEAEVGDGGDSG